MPNANFDLADVQLHQLPPWSGYTFKNMWTVDLDADQRAEIVLAYEATLESGVKRAILATFRRDSIDHSRFDPKPHIRVLSQGIDSINTGREWAFGDFGDYDGDGVFDFSYGWTRNSTPDNVINQVRLYLSRSRKSWWDRVLDSADAELIYITDQHGPTPETLGFVNDSNRRFEMLHVPQGGTRGFAGGVNGPDPLWDVTAPIPVLTFQDAGDIQGDGWGDVLGEYTGVVAIYAGGPEIPRDPSAGVEWTAIAGEHQRAIAVWPQPAREVVHIAWRGDLKRMPRHFRIVDAAGTLVAEGSVESWRGEVLWECASRPSGLYTCSITDGEHMPVATARILIQH